MTDLKRVVLASQRPEGGAWAGIAAGAAEGPLWVETGQSLSADPTAGFRPRTLQTCHSAFGQTYSFSIAPMPAVLAGGLCVPQT